MVIEFKDTGEGMSEEVRRRAFSSLLSTTKSKGTGLGLAIVARVVETHRGKVKVNVAAGERHDHSDRLAFKRCLRLD